MIDRTFNGCVEILIWMAGLCGISYEAINVIIFCILWPTLTVWMAIAIWRQRIQIHQLKREQ
jgi:hypothetical protein